jgi:hypothetical protein
MADPRATRFGARRPWETRMLRRLIAIAAAVAVIVLVSALPAPAPAAVDQPTCASATATPEDLGPSASPEDLARGFVCRENGEAVGRALAGD